MPKTTEYLSDVLRLAESRGDYFGLITTLKAEAGICFEEDRYEPNLETLAFGNSLNSIAAMIPAQGPALASLPLPWEKPS